MNNPTEQQIAEAINKCQFRKNIHEVDVCIGELKPCKMVIDEIKCDTLIKLYYGKSKTDMLVEQFVKRTKE